ncbi:MAG TPA: flagellar basal body rod protein FlgB [Ignavibacteriales bacterium]|jgi:flagellar basal-body rod protein FlgB|nr:flagellar basal body rod protein FlgB [Ignavibacteriales bacterium]
MKKLVTHTAAHLEKMLDYYALKNKIISRNIANIATEGYQRQDVVFKEVLNSELDRNLKTTNEKHITDPKAQFPTNSKYSDFEITEDENPEKISGINNVDIDQEMADLASNNIKFKFAAKRLNSYYKNLQGVIKGDRGGQ